MRCSGDGMRTLRSISMAWLRAAWWLRSRWQRIASINWSPIPSLRPDSTEKLMPSTAVNSPPSTWKQVVKSRTSSNALIGQAPRYPLRYWPWKRPSGSCGRLARLAAGSVKTRDFRFDHAAIDDASRVLAAGQARNERLKAFQTDLVQTAQFNQRFCVIVDPQIERRVVLPAVGDQIGALLAAFVA